MHDKLRGLISEYFDLGVAEGREGRSHDNEAGDAQRVLSEIEAEIAALSAQVQDVPEGKIFYTTRKNWEKTNFGSFISAEHMGVVLDAIDECWANADLKITISEAPAKQDI